MKAVCLIALISNDYSENAKKEIEEAVEALKWLKHWRVDKVTLLEDKRDCA
mgnify:CR=1 FL=1